MSNKKCSCFGHREVYQNIDTELLGLLENLIIHNGADTFWVGGIGQFDAKFASAVRSLKHKYPHISLVLVKPYFSGELNTNKEYYESFYDDILIPDILMGVHYKRAITMRNRWMVDHSDFIVTFVHRDFGGAFDTKTYANKQNKLVFELSK